MTQSRFSNPTTHKVINALLFQACWFSAILLGWPYAVLPLVLLIAHGLRFEPGQHAYVPLSLLVVGGLILDSLLIFSGHFVVPQPHPPSLGLTPLWLVCMWCAFALTLNSSLSWWQQFPKTFAMVCAVAGPMSYFAGTRFGVLEITATGFGFHAIAWLALGAAIVFFIPKGKLAKPAPRTTNWNRQICGVE